MSRSLLLVAVSCLLLLLLLPSQSVGTDSLQITQVEITSGGTVPHPVDGIATYEIGPQARHFDFHCVSVVNDNDGSGLSWSKLNEFSTRTQTLLPKGISLDFSSPLQSDSGTYRCSDIHSTLQKDIVITTDNPAALATTPTQEADQGDNVTLRFFVSGLPAVMDSEITWLHNGVAMTSGDFQEGRKQLRLRNAQPSDAGNYTILVETDEGTASATTLLTINADEISEQPITVTSTIPSPTSIGDLLTVTPALTSTTQQPITISTITVTQCPTITQCNCPATPYHPTLTQSPSQSTTPPQVALPFNLTVMDFGLIGALGIMTLITVILLVVIMLLSISLKRAKSTSNEPPLTKKEHLSMHPASESSGFSLQSRSKQELLSS